MGAPISSTTTVSTCTGRSDAFGMLRTTARTCQSRRLRARTKWFPMNPVAPVTRIVTVSPALATRHPRLAWPSYAPGRLACLALPLSAQFARARPTPGGEVWQRFGREVGWVDVMQIEAVRHSLVERSRRLFGCREHRDAHADFGSTLRRGPGAVLDV